MTISLTQTLPELLQAIFALDPIIVVLDTTGLESDADIIRLHIANYEGRVLYDQVMQPQRRFNPNTAYTGLSEEQLLQAPTLADQWDDIQCYLRGSFILAYNLKFVVERLRENARHYRLPVIPMVGACLQRQAQAYFNVGRLSLQSACERVGLPMPAFASERAIAQSMLLKAMSEGRKVADPPTVTENTNLEELEDHPF